MNGKKAVSTKRVPPKNVEVKPTSDGGNRLYLDLMVKTLTGMIYGDPPISVFGWRQFKPLDREGGRDWPSRAYSMVGEKRMNNFRTLIERVIQENVAGDIIETGVWRGGACIMARAVLKAYGITDRRVILADSFEGLPPPDGKTYPADKGATWHKMAPLAVSLEHVKENFNKFDFLDDQVVFLKGWFKDTMPLVESKKIAVLRLDGDMYESTITVLDALYDKVTSGGWVIVDDYDLVPACKQAVTDFLERRKLAPEIIPIDGIGVYFQKN
jgi:O-methyltransferase